MELFYQTFEDKLKVLDFNVDSSSESSVISIADADYQKLNGTQILAIEDAKHLGADAVFFRYFDDRQPLPQIYIYDNTSGRLSEKTDYAKIHRALWSSCNIPTFFIVENTSIKIFDSRAPVKISIDGTEIVTHEIAKIDLENLEHYSSVIEQYKAVNFNNGMFWESKEASKHYSYTNTPYEALVRRLKEFRKQYHLESNLSETLADYLIILSILIKYLEENGIDEQGKNLAEEFFVETTGLKTYSEILRNGILIKLLDALAKKFNGGVFQLDKSQKRELHYANYALIADFVDASTDVNGQFALWPLYSFKHIPVELVSNIYEEFLPKENKGAVYTPSHLVNFLVDESIPLPKSHNDKDHLNYNIKSIDVSCGSGIFLVSVFKRLVQRFKINSYYKNSKIPHVVGVTNLQSILLNNVFGVDIDPNARNLAIFSLNIALCQMLSPKQIWTELKFPDLKGNIVKSDFFAFSSKHIEAFDLVIGNPPFNPPANSEGTVLKKSEYVSLLRHKYNVRVDSLKDPNPALLFLHQSIKILKQGGLLCLIQPTVSLLYNSENQEFRSEIFSKYNIPQIIDFTYFRRILFNATVPTVVVFLERKLPSHEAITHVVVRRTKSSREKLFFEIDHYDLCSVNRDEINNTYVWKNNLLGGSTLNSLIQRMKEIKLSTIQQYCKQHGLVVKSGWTKQEVSRNKNKGFFISRKVTEGVFPAIIYDGKTYTTENWGIVGDKNNISALKKISNYLIKKGTLLCFYIVSTSSRQGLDRPYNVNPKDINELPLLPRDFRLTKDENITVEDIVKFKITEFGQGENAAINNHIRISKSMAIPREIIDYTKVFAETLNTYYIKEKQKFFFQSFYNCDAFFVCVFVFSKNDIDNPNQTYSQTAQIQSLLKSDKDVYASRIIKLFQGNRILIIKPTNVRYWLKSFALTDAFETLEDIVQLGYKTHD